jgi:hypothetical protein
MNTKGLLLRVTCLAVAVTVIAAGCGDKKNSNTARLSGTVTIQGQPLAEDAEGYIQFMPASGGQAQPAHTEIVEGKYDAENVPLGQVTAIFHITRLTGRMVREDNAPGATPYPEREDLVPRKHRAGVTIQIEGDNDAHDFEL